MDNCEDYKRHELLCEHVGPRTRWQTRDGCSGSCCQSCWFMKPLSGTRGAIPRSRRYAGPAAWPDLVALAVLDGDGIPLDRRAWTEGDRIGDAVREFLPGISRRNRQLTEPESPTQVIR